VESHAVTGRDRRVLLAGGSIVAAAILVLRVLPWGVRRAIAAERGLREQAALLAHTRADLAQAPILGDSAAQLTRALAGLAPKLLTGDTRAEAAADLAGRLNLVAARQQVKLERVDQLPDSQRAGRLRRLGVRINVESDIRGITGLLDGLARGDAALSIDALRVVAADPGAAGSGPEILKGEIIVSGWFLTLGESGMGKGEDGR
jgi:hypothetical protein